VIEKIIKFIDLPCVVEKKRKEIFGYVLDCSSDNISSLFKIQVCSKIYQEINSQQNYILLNVPVFQTYDSKGKPRGKPIIKPSNIDF